MSTKEAGELALSPTPRRSLIRCRWKWIFFVTLVVLAGATSSDKLQHRTYVSSSSVVLSPQIFGDGAEPLPADMGTAKAVASTTVVLAPAAQTLGITVDDLRKDLTVTVPADTNLLTFAAKGSTPRRPNCEPRSSPGTSSHTRTPRWRRCASRLLLQPAAAPAPRP